MPVAAMMAGDHVAFLKRGDDADVRRFLPCAQMRQPGHRAGGGEGTHRFLEVPDQQHRAMHAKPIWRKLACSAGSRRDFWFRHKSFRRGLRLARFLVLQRLGGPAWLTWVDGIIYRSRPTIAFNKRDATAEETMAFRGPTSADILASKYATSMPSEVTLPQADTRHYFQAIDNMINVFAIKPDDKVLFLTDPLLDRRIVDCITGVANSRGVFPREFMAPSTQLPDCPDEVRALVEDATFVVSSWFCSVNSPFFVKLRKEKGQRWVKITYFRNLDLLQTPQARFPVDLVGEIVRATARMYPKDHDFDMHFSCPRGSDLTIKFTPPMVKGLLSNNRWLGQQRADQPGCYVHYMPTHGPNLYDRNCFPARATPSRRWPASFIRNGRSVSRSLSKRRSALNTRMGLS